MLGPASMTPPIDGHRNRTCGVYSVVELSGAGERRTGQHESERRHRMPRPERPLELDGTALVEFAVDLRRLRQDAGGTSYRELGKRGGYSATTLAEAAAGRRFP